MISTLVALMVTSNGVGQLDVQQVAKTLPRIPREFRAAWVATVDNIDWPSKRDLSTEKQKQELLAIVEKANSLNLNALVFQIRPSADALYKSDLEPWSEYMTGLQGRAPSPMWDPLSFIVEECHKRGMELHVWFNPYRANHPAQKGPLSSSHIGRTNPEVVKTYGRYQWMDPGEPMVQKRSLDVMLDVVKRYDIDGVHIDDYFYPYPIQENKQDVPFPDGASYGRYQASGGKLGKADWRRKNVDDFIENVYKGIKRTKRHVKFGISPFGIYRPGIPAGIKAGVDQYADLYADAQKWFVEGWCDYYTPQLYWPINQVPQSYKTLYNWWLTQNPKGRHLWPGLYTGRTNPAEGNWNPSEVINQVKLTRAKQDSPGNVHFSFKCLQRDYNGIATALKNGLYAKDAFVPASPWLGDLPPKRPEVGMVREGGFNEIKFDRPDDSLALAVSFGTKTDNGIQWTDWSSNGDSLQVKGVNFHYVAAVAFSRTGIASEPRILEVK